MPKAVYSPINWHKQHLHYHAREWRLNKLVPSLLLLDSMTLYYAVHIQTLTSYSGGGVGEGGGIRLTDGAANQWRN